MKIMFVCRSFHNMAGGIERVGTGLMTELVQRGHQVYLLTWDKGKPEAFYDMDPRIQWLFFNLGSHMVKANWSTRFKRMLKARNLVNSNQPDVIIAFQQGAFFFMFLSTLGLKIPLVAAEREAPNRYDHIKVGKWRNLIFQTFRFANKITIQIESYAKDYPNYLKDKLVTIPNPVHPAKIYAKPEGNGQKILLSAGRLEYQKNHKVLIQAFSHLAHEFPDWKVLIAGEGALRAQLDEQINQLGLSGRICLLGAVKDMPALYAQSHLMCLPARWEGFPNVVAESLAHGLPVVGFAGCSGTADLIQDGLTGFLAEGNNNAPSLTETLRKAMKLDTTRKQMGQAAIESIKPYAPEKVYSQWETFFLNIIKD